MRSGEIRSNQVRSGRTLGQKSDRRSNSFKTNGFLVFQSVRQPDFRSEKFDFQVRKATGGQIASKPMVFESFQSVSPPDFRSEKFDFQVRKATGGQIASKPIVFNHSSQPVSPISGQKSYRKVKIYIKPMVFSHSSQSVSPISGQKSDQRPNRYKTYGVQSFQSVSQSISQSVSHPVILARQTLHFHLGKTESLHSLSHSVFSS